MSTKIKIIPAIDIIEGKCVRLSQGDYDQKKVYNENPLEVAKSFEDHGIEQLHLVDLDGAKSKRVINYPVLERIASRTGLRIDFGGGVKSDEDIKRVLESGANQVTAGSIAVKDPETVYRWIRDYGPAKIILGADVRDRKIAINGWKEDSGLELFEYLEKFTNRGISTAICTDIAKDGMMAGSSVTLYKDMLSKFPELNLIASGGVASMDEVIQLQESGLYGAIVGKAIYEGQISLKDIANFYK
ncbi:MAG: 1-(5-phosphoribosyl)-5-[(5-phosphoribosylamino)methylideneamino]imidazole-4-carboxamide isomerase [Bacteroidota bacterium]